MIKITKINTLGNPKILEQDYRTSIIKTAVDKVEREMLTLFQKTVKTWNQRPKFNSKRTVANGLYTIDVGTGSKLYGLINDGTDVIYDVLSKDFRAKTKPGVLDSFPGVGFKIRTSLTPLPGIIPRRWDDAMVDHMEPFMFKFLDEELKFIFKVHGHEL